jgi:hypothetical protein
MKTDSDKIARRASMRRDTFNKTQNKSEFSDKYQLGNSNALQISSPGIYDPTAHLGWVKQNTLGNIAEMSITNSPSV